MKFLPSLLFLSLLLSCSQDHLGKIVTEEEILKRLSTLDPTMRLLPDNRQVIGCQFYQGCKKFIRANFNNIEIFLVELKSEKLAKKYAEQKKILHYGNWLFDNIQRETGVLEKLSGVGKVNLNQTEPVSQEENKASESHH